MSAGGGPRTDAAARAACGAGGRNDARTAITVVHRCPGRRHQRRAAPQDHRVHPILRARAERQLGLFTAADARMAGYGHPEIRHLLSSGAWVRVRRGVYSTREHLNATDSRHAVDCLALLLELGRPGAVISHASAARLWGIPVRRHHATPLRLTDPTGWRRGRDFRMAQAPLRPGEVVERGPLAFTSAPRTLIDCAREWDLEDAVVAMDAALLAGRVTPEELARAAAGIHHWPGAPRAARAACLADGRAESPLETRGRLRLVGAGLTPSALQVEIRAAGRLVGVVDAWFDDAAVAVEFDGKVKYTDPWRGRTPERALWEEKRREDELRALDIRFVRIVDADVDTRWARVEARLRQLMTEPGPLRRSFTATARLHGRLRAG